MVYSVDSGDSGDLADRRRITLSLRSSAPQKTREVGEVPSIANLRGSRDCFSFRRERLSVDGMVVPTVRQCDFDSGCLPYPPNRKLH